MPAALTFSLNGVALPVTAIEKRSFTFTERIGSRNSGSVAFVGALGTIAAKHGQTFTVVRNGTTLFGGRVYQPQRRLLGLTHVRYDCRITDFGEALDRRLIAATYVNQTLQQIVTDIVANSLDGEGITTGGV